ncbi:MAG: PAS domain-containing protein [Phycisphaerales bacterium]|nr:MAG: PAS domain-containing protein [Phycisphaerales bacterium]
MAKDTNMTAEARDRPSRYAREALFEHLLWLIRLRWAAVGAVVGAGVLGSYVFPVLTSAVPIWICAAVLLLCNVVYFLVATKKPADTGPKDMALGVVQAEVDLVILTAVLHFSGGVVNPFFLFYIFPIIIATIILPRSLSFAVGLTAILLFGLLAINELNGGGGLGYYPLQLAAASGLSRNPVYLLGAFVAFVCMVVFARYLTSMIIARMAAKELEAARNNDLLEAVISAMSEGLIFVTRKGEVAICNPAAKLWKKDGGTVRAGDSLNGFPKVLAERIQRLLLGGNGTKDTGQVIEFTTTGPEERHIEAKSSAVTSIDGQELGYVVVGQDLTEHKKLERELLERTDEVTAINEMLKMSRVEMAQREKMVAIGQMATGIAHEIGNPLASLSSVVQYLGRTAKAHEEKEQLLAIRYQVNRISNILKRMLSLSRPATAEHKWVDLNELIDNTLSLVKFDKRVRSVTVKNITCPDLPMVWLNPQLLEQVLLNIIINALDAMDAKRSQQEHVLEITRQSDNGTIEIRVSDTGVGMSPEVCKRAFESFFTTKEIGKGTGLGLFISYNLVTEMDGTIAMDSEPDNGTTVAIRLPIRPREGLISGGDNQRDPISSAQTREEPQT